MPRVHPAVLSGDPHARAVSPLGYRGWNGKGPAAAGMAQNFGAGCAPTASKEAFASSENGQHASAEPGKQCRWELESLPPRAGSRAS